MKKKWAYNLHPLDEFGQVAQDAFDARVGGLEGGDFVAGVHYRGVVATAKQLADVVKWDVKELVH